MGNVEPNTAASRAGLRPGDIIIRYDGVMVDHFDHIRDLIAKNEVGESVPVEFVRGGQKRETTVTLGEWP